MCKRSRQAMILALGILSMPLPVSARGPCNPPTAKCDGGDGITYACPPCRPNITRVEDDGRAALEIYRESLENYRKALEARRAGDPAGKLQGYQEGIDSYREGIASYREGQAAVQATSAGER